MPTEMAPTSQHAGARRHWEDVRAGWQQANGAGCSPPPISWITPDPQQAPETTNSWNPLATFRGASYSPGVSHPINWPRPTPKGNFFRLVLERIRSVSLQVDSWYALGMCTVQRVGQCSADVIARIAAYMPRPDASPGVRRLSVLQELSTNRGLDCRRRSYIVCEDTHT
jgi:hypothetical protein